MTDERVQLRQRLRAARARIALTTRRRAADIVAHRIQHDPAFRRCRSIGLYAATGSELSVWPLAAASVAARKRVFLPCVRGTRMHFAAWDPAKPLRAGAFGIAEPPAGAVRAWRARIDLVVFPLLGFDAHCNRLGQGGGYYDRAFAAHLARAWRHTTLFGVAYDRQLCEQLDVQPWDVPLDKVFTEKRCYPGATVMNA